MGASPTWMPPGRSRSSRRWRCASPALEHVTPGLRRRMDRLLWLADGRSEEHTSELQSQSNLVCRLLLEKKKKTKIVASEPIDMRTTARPHPLTTTVSGRD